VQVSFRIDLFVLFLTERKMLEVMVSSMLGTYYYPCKFIKKTDPDFYMVTYSDPYDDDREVTVIVQSKDLRGVIPTGVVHKVKSWAHFFDAINAGLKTHELRHDDRNYQIGDEMVLQRYDNINGKYTGEECRVAITYITNRTQPCAFSSGVLQRDYCILSIRKVDEVS
jgi:hypothetical protein